MITIGRMAERFGMLPSDVATTATTYDLMITDALATWDRYEQSKRSGKFDPAVYDLSSDELQDIINKNKKQPE